MRILGREPVHVHVPGRENSLIVENDGLSPLSSGVQSKTEDQFSR